MSKKLNNSLSVILAFSLLLNQALYADFFNEFSQFKNNTSGFETYEDYYGSKVVSVGGAFSIKRTAPTYAPWWSVQAPSIDASCSGVDFKGMFGTIIDLDQLEKQFEEAGQSYAWGILVGIIYSLPGVGEVFQKINDWANKIQAMLANACNAGIAAGKGIMNAPINDTGGVADNLKSASDWTDTTVTNGEKKLASIFDCTDPMWTETAHSGDCSDAKDAATNILGRSWTTYPSIMTYTLLSYYKKHNSWVTGSAPSGVEVIDWNSTTLTNETPLLRDISFYGLLSSAAGEVVVDGKQVDSITQALAVVTDTTKNETQKEAAIKKATKIFKLSNGKSKELEGGISTEELLNYLMNGKDSNASIERIEAGYRLPVVVSYTQKPKGSNAASITAMSSDRVVPFSSMPEGLKTPISSYEGVGALAKANKECYLDGADANSTACSTAKNALFSSEEARYYAKIYKNTVSATDKKILGENYETLVRFTMLKAIVGKIREAIAQLDRNYEVKVTAITATTASTETERAPSVDTITPTNKVRRNLRELKKMMDTKIDKDMTAKHINFLELRNQFENQNRKNIKRVYRTNG